MSEMEQAEIQDKVDAPLADGEIAASDDEQKPVYNKIQVKDVITREKQKAYERGKRDMQEQLQQQAQQQETQQPQAMPASQPAAPQSSFGGMSQLSPDDIRRMISEQAPQALHEHVQREANKSLAHSFSQKMQAAEEKYPGLEAKLNDLDFTTISPLIKTIDSMDNAGEIMKELVIDNPMKLGNLTALLYTQPKLAEKAIHDLSNSIKKNQQALAEESSSNEPFSAIKPSTQAGMDNGQQTTSDFRNMPWLRG